MSKVSHLSFSLNAHFLWRTNLLQIPISLCVIFIIVTPAMLFGTSNYPICHIFLILFTYTFSCLNHIFSSITISPAMPSTTSNSSSQTPSVNGRQPKNPTKQHLPWSGNVSTLLPPCCQPLPLLAACCLPLAAQCWCWPLPLYAWPVIQLWSVHRSLSKQNKIRWALFA